MATLATRDGQTQEKSSFAGLWRVNGGDLAILVQKRPPRAMGVLWQTSSGMRGGMARGL
ncbi:hypothetical protein V6Z11_A06G067900 [Gossypium hirsutum]